VASSRTSFYVRFTVTAAVLFAIVVLFNAVLSSVSVGRFDLTDDGVYTISPSAKKVLSDLEVPVEVKLYITARAQMPSGLQNIERDVVDKLNEFNVVSGGNLRFRVVDPSDDEELKTKVAAKGIRPFQVQSIEKDAMGIKLVYSAIEIAYKEKDPEVIPQVLPETLSTLEYAVCSAITRLIRDRDPVVAVYASRQSVDPQLMQMYLQMGQQPPAPQEIYEQSQQMLQAESYDVRRVEITSDSPIPDEATTLVVLAPRNLEERQLYEINRFVQRGGRLIVATQRFEYNYAPGRQGGFNISSQEVISGIDPLLEKWGIQISDRLLMDENNEVLAIPSTRNVGGLRLQVSEPVQAPMQIRVTADQLNDEISIANGVGDLLYLWGSRLEIDPQFMVDNSLNGTPVMHSSSAVWEFDPSPGPLPPSAFLPDPDSELASEPLAVLLTGVIPNAYPSGSIPEWNATPDSARTLEAVEEFIPVESQVFVVGCAKMFDDSLLRGMPGNGLMLLNAVDALTLGGDLIQIRAKVTATRAIGQVGDGEKLFYRFLTIGLIPLLIAVFGVSRIMRRRREEADFLVAQGG
jgi:ABC-type uncharacterized transport system involved in gliding motility auxiliary subunit